MPTGPDRGDQAPAAYLPHIYEYVLYFVAKWNPAWLRPFLGVSSFLSLWIRIGFLILWGGGAFPSVDRSLQASLPLLEKKLRLIGGPFTATKFFLSLPHSQPYIWLHFLFIDFLHKSCCCWRFSCWSCAFSCWYPLLKDGVLVAAGILAVANIPAVACFPAVAGGVISWCLTAATSFPRTSSL